MLPVPMVTELRPCQRKVFDFITSQPASAHASLFLTGVANSGKTHVLRVAVQALKEQGVPVCVAAASREAAAVLGGVRLSRVLGHRSVDDILDPRQNLCRLLPPYSIDLLRTTQVLVIDDVNGVSARMLEALDRAARFLRPGGLSLPMGGMRLVMAGDFLADTPVHALACASEAWALLDPVRIELTIVVGQTETSRTLGEVVAQARVGLVSPLLTKAPCCIRDEETLASTLASARSCTLVLPDAAAVSRYNAMRLEQLPGETVSYCSTKAASKTRLDGLLAEHPMTSTLALRVGALVALIVPQGGVAAGRLGHVTRLDPVADARKGVDVHFHAAFGAPAATVTIRPVLVCTYTRADQTPAAHRETLPLMVAYACTPRRLTLFSRFGAEKVYVPCPPAPGFAAGLGYVLLSRLHSLSQFVTNDTATRAIIAHARPDAIAIYGQRAE